MSFLKFNCHKYAFWDNKKTNFQILFPNFFVTFEQTGIYISWNVFRIEAIQCISRFNQTQMSQQQTLRISVMILTGKNCDSI